MTFFAFGINYECASVQTKEAFTLGPDRQRALYNAVSLSEEAEVVVLSTCNRTEAYLYGRPEDVETVRKLLCLAAGQSWPDAQSFCLEDEAAVRHVLEVTSGIRSMVVGDGQILAQMKDAYQRAVDAGCVHSVMHRLMHAAFRAAKRVTRDTNLASGAASISTAAVAMARDHFTPRDAGADLQGVHVLLVGAGKMGRLALSALDTEAPSSVTVTNRSPDKARAVADEYGARTAPWDERYAAVERADVILVATGAPEPVVMADRLPQGSARQKLFVDISMPRNVDPAVDTIDGCRVCDLDSLQAWTQEVQAQRSREIPEAQSICDEQLQEFVTWVFHQQAMQPAIEAIRETFDAIREQEVERHAHRTGMKREEVDRLTKSIMQKLLAVPIVKLKNVDPESIDFVQGIQLLHALFSSSDDSEPGGRALDEKSDASAPSLSDVPSGCPFHEEAAEDAQPEEEIDDALIRRALTVTRRAS
jgi:glutamyl-tRNA reductase